MMKLKWYLDCFLLKQNIVVIFDNFEENQDEKKSGEFLDERLKEFMWYFREALRNKGSILFFSTRYKLPDFDIETIDVGEFSTVEFHKMLLNTQALKKLDDGSIKTLLNEIGGNPRAIELLDRVAWQEFGQREFNWEDLNELIPELQERLIHKKTVEDNFTPLFLGKLLEYLNQAQRRLLDILSIYRISVPKEAVMAHDTAIVRKDRKKLEDLSLLEYMRDKGLYYVHRLTAQYVLGQMEEEVRKQYHRRAGEYFYSIVYEESKKYIEDAIESRWHFLQAGEWDRAAEITIELESYLTLHGYPQMSFELLKEINDKTLNDENRSIVLHQMGILYHGFGDYNAALEKFLQSLEIKKKIGDIKDASKILLNIGVINQEKGDYETALEMFQQSMEIMKKIDYNKGVSASLQLIGRIYQESGYYEAALKKFQQLMEISEKMGDIKTIYITLQNIGIIYQEKGDYEGALEMFQQAMEIDEKSGNIDGVAIIMNHIGHIYFIKKDYYTALKMFFPSFQILSKIGSPNAEVVNGNIARVRENMPEEEFEAILKEFEIPDKEKT
jgi:tetratricopeptide (TPR) repeat protein